MPGIHRLVVKGVKGAKYFHVAPLAPLTLLGIFDGEFPIGVDSGMMVGFAAKASLWAPRAGPARLQMGIAPSFLFP